MSKIVEELVLKNWVDVSDVQRGLKKESEVRSATVKFMADTGAHHNTLNEDDVKNLGLTKEGSRSCKLADGSSGRFDTTSLAEIWWHDRSIPMPFIIVPKGTINLLSITAMELLDIVPDPSKGKLVGEHGDEFVTLLM
jgi:predicted aspartyl protease